MEQFDEETVTARTAHFDHILGAIAHAHTLLSDAARTRETALALTKLDEAKLWVQEETQK